MTSIEPWKNEWEEMEVIGRGGQGKITLLRNRVNNENAVLKTIVSKWKNDEQARDRLERECKILKQLHSYGALVPEVYDSSHNHKDSTPFIVMEYIRGTLLEKWLAKNAPMALLDGIMIVRSLLKTIEICHNNRIGHRDIKPANVMFQDDDISRAYVFDFGICFDSQQTRALTREGEMFWNEFILLPECQDLEGGEQDLRSDITALVGVLFRCITGKSPITLLDSKGRPPQVRHGDELKKNSAPLFQFQNARLFFDKGFSYEIDDRYQTIEEFKSALQLLEESATGSPDTIAAQLVHVNNHIRENRIDYQIAIMKDQFHEIIQGIKPRKATRYSECTASGWTITAHHYPASFLNLPNIPCDSQDRPLDVKETPVFILEKGDYDLCIVAAIAGVFSNRNMNIYGSSYLSRKSNPLNQSSNPSPWRLILTIPKNSDDQMTSFSSQVMEGIFEALILATHSILME